MWAHNLAETLYHGMNGEFYARDLRQTYKRRQLVFATAAAHKRAYDPLSDIDDTLAGLETTVKELSAGVGIAPVRPIGMTILDTLDQIGSGTRKRTPTGFHGLDGLLGGLRPGQLIVVGARPAMGKTAWALNVVDNMASAGAPCGFISLEMSTQELSERLLARRARVALHELEVPSDAVKFALAEEANRLQTLPLVFDESSHELEEVVSSIREMRRTHGIEVVVVDYLGLIQSSRRTGSP